MTTTKPVSELLNAFAEHMSSAAFKTALINAQISARITKERIDRKMTQTDFAKLLGVTQPMVSKWEAGDYNFTISSVSQIFEKLGLDYSFAIIDNNTSFPKVSYNLAETKTMPHLIGLRTYTAIAS